MATKMTAIATAASAAKNFTSVVTPDNTAETPPTQTPRRKPASWGAAFRTKDLGSLSGFS